ncbi:MAG: LPS-assembly protein LptD, partial [Gemmatimonadales bacterium]
PVQRPTARDSARADSLRNAGQSVDTSTARRLGLPTGPTRSFPAADAVIDSLLKLPEFRVTRYVSETLVVQGDSQTIFLRREAFVEREGTQLEADSIRYHEASCQLDATGDPHLFDQGTVLVGEGMRYDTCIRRGTVRDALTDFQQGGAKWYVRGNLAVDSGSTRVYAHSANFTSDPQPVPDYHFAAGQVKWINKRTMVARPAVLYVRDVPIMWLPFIFQDIRGGRRSGILFPRFGLNDLVRPTRRYSRHISDLGYYFAINDYVDALVTGDWFAGRYVQVHGQAQYRWLDRFMQGSLTYSRMSQLDHPGVNTRVGWSHSQRFDSRTSLNAHVDYATNGTLIQRNSLNPWEVTARIGSTLNFDKRFSWGAFNVGGTRYQDLSQGGIEQSFPTVTLTPSAVAIAPWITWSPTFSFTNQQRFHQAGGSLLIPALPSDTNPVDTLSLFRDDRTSTLTFSTPLRIGRWNWVNNFRVVDARSNGRQEFAFTADSTGSIRRLLFGQTFETDIDWSTSINLPPLFSGTWKIQPGVSIANQTGGFPFMVRNELSGGRYVHQGKRLSFSLGASPTFFGFFAGFGPFSRIRHSISPIISYQYAPGTTISEEFARVVDPTGRSLTARGDPQQTISLGFSQNFEAKLKPAAGDTASDREPRKIRLLSISTSAISFNFEQAKIPGRVGWQTQGMSNTFLSDLLPGFQLSISHDLWKGQAGTDSARFNPFLQSMQASFQVTPATLQGISRFLGLRPRPAAQPAAVDTMTAVEGRRDDLRRYQGASRDPYGMRGPGVGGVSGGYGGGTGFSLGVQLSSTRSRGDTSRAALHRAGRETAGLSLQFSPTRNWTASWITQYDIVTRQFAAHSLSFQRDLRRWRASFGFQKTAAGNFAFLFNIVLTDQPDIKFDYDQHTYVQ